MSRTIGFVEQAKIEQAKKEAEEVKEKGVVIIRYTIVDPNKVLADKKPESVVLKQGLMARPKWDERSFLMEMGGEIRDLLEGHNGIRTEIQYENDKGDLVFLKEAKLADLDVVVEVIKQYE